MMYPHWLRSDKYPDKRQIGRYEKQISRILHLASGIDFNENEAQPDLPGASTPSETFLEQFLEEIRNFHF